MIPNLLMHILDALMRRAAPAVDDPNHPVAVALYSWRVLIEVRQRYGGDALAHLPRGMGLGCKVGTPLINSMCSGEARFECAVSSVHK